jgi:hypothetical protein
MHSSLTVNRTPEYADAKYAITIVKGKGKGKEDYDTASSDCPFAM